ncbi:sensor histidine kinase [Sporolactobacillus terrae]|uniref:histidine kinase n=1 Tax=Sporolactobacillus terrae TaxID=269673 RepID=A0ABX5QAB0_9BACL|nr:HAMP domain-containing sensor histidine kinase [Sporolactobacillus terrae]QAA23580.1 two-component sensor histidine kinase [Sporolactobacillus terrae]QAA26550.1 two-component sensor histidine kinase [Sporolactobacillus terrae]UAK15623.1 HAMP domain-containing histidine kinase [Sporolactobacillus terrae]
MDLFRKTLIKLTILNAALLILLLSLLGGTIYFYEKNVTFRNSDQALMKSVDSPDVPRMNQRPMPGGGMVEQRLRNPRLYWVIVNAKNEQKKSSLDFAEGTQVSKQFFKPFLTATSENSVEQRVDDNYYHLLVRKADIDGQAFKVIFINDVTAEKNLLNTLQMIILLGLAIGAFVSIIAGYFLAWRALQPIEKAWNRQNRFVADASHELRTPLSIIQLKIEGLLRQPRQKVQESGEDIAVMLDETRRLSKLVGNLLTLARSDANRLEVTLAPFDLKAMIKKVTEPFSEMAEFEEKAFSLEVSEDPIYINGDEQRAHQLLVILLDNAMKFTSKNGAIQVACSRENKFAKLTISDSGCGLSEKELPHIFDRFYQVDQSRTERKGTGLGLSIADWIVSKHRGKIEVESELGKGTTFTVRLPLMKNEPEIERNAQGEDAEHDEKA